MKLPVLPSRPSPRQWVLVAALGLSLAATAWVASRDEEEPVAPAPRRSTASARPTTTADWPRPLSSERSAWPPSTPTARAAWGEPPPAAAPPTAAALAAASTAAEPEDSPPPPFPYQLVGRMTDTRPRAVLNGPQRSLVLGVGDVIDGQWRIEAIEPGGLRVQHLPDGPSQFIAFSSS